MIRSVGVNGLEVLVIRSCEEPVAGLLGLALVCACVSTPTHLDIDVRRLVLVE